LDVRTTLMLSSYLLLMSSRCISGLPSKWHLTTWKIAQEKLLNHMLRLVYIQVEEKQRTLCFREALIFEVKKIIWHTCFRSTFYEFVTHSHQLESGRKTSLGNRTVHDLYAREFHRCVLCCPHVIYSEISCHMLCTFWCKGIHMASAHREKIAGIWKKILRRIFYQKKDSEVWFCIVRTGAFCEILGPTS
jgi:hypothetical protein